MEQNPYAPSQVSPVANPSSHEAITITPIALIAITKTKFWVKFLSIAMFVIVAFQILSIIMNINTPGNDGSLFITIIFIVINLTLATRLLQYGKAISTLTKNHHPLSFERAMEVQTKYWKLVGIICVVIIAMILITFIGGATA